MAEYDGFYDFSASYEAFLGRLRVGEKVAKNEKDESESEEERDDGAEDERAVVLVEESAKGYNNFLFSFALRVIPFPPKINFSALY
jgi:hypothetical protein